MIQVKKLSQFGSVIANLRDPRRLFEGDNWAAANYAFAPQQVSALNKIAAKFDAAETGETVSLSKKDTILLLASTYVEETNYGSTKIVESAETAKVRRAITAGGNTELAETTKATPQRVMGIWR